MNFAYWNAGNEDIDNSIPYKKPLQPRIAQITKKPETKESQIASSTSSSSSSSSSVFGSIINVGKNIVQNLLSSSSSPSISPSASPSASSISSNNNEPGRKIPSLILSAQPEHNPIPSKLYMNPPSFHSTFDEYNKPNHLLSQTSLFLKPSLTTHKTQIHYPSTNTLNNTLNNNLNVPIHTQNNTNEEYFEDNSSSNIVDYTSHWENVKEMNKKGQDEQLEDQKEQRLRESKWNKTIRSKTIDIDESGNNSGDESGIDPANIDTIQKPLHEIKSDAAGGGGAGGGGAGGGGDDDDKDDEDDDDGIDPSIIDELTQTQPTQSNNEDNPEKEMVGEEEEELKEEESEGLKPKKKHKSKRKKRKHQEEEELLTDTLVEYQPDESNEMKEENANNDDVEDNEEEGVTKSKKQKKQGRKEQKKLKRLMKKKLRAQHEEEESVNTIVHDEQQALFKEVEFMDKKNQDQEREERWKEKYERQNILRMEPTHSMSSPNDYHDIIANLSRKSKQQKRRREQKEESEFLENSLAFIESQKELKANLDQSLSSSSSSSSSSAQTHQRKKTRNASSSSLVDSDSKTQSQPTTQPGAPQPTTSSLSEDEIRKTRARTELEVACKILKTTTLQAVIPEDIRKLRDYTAIMLQWYVTAKRLLSSTFILRTNHLLFDKGCSPQQMTQLFSHNLLMILNVRNTKYNEVLKDTVESQLHETEEQFGKNLDELIRTWTSVIYSRWVLYAEQQRLLNPQAPPIEVPPRDFFLPKEQLYITKPDQKLLEFMYQMAQKLGYQRDQKGNVYEQLITEEGHETHYYKRKCDMREFIAQTCYDNMALHPYMFEIYTNLKGTPEHVYNMLSILPSKRFPLTNRMPRYFSFRNGILDIAGSSEEEEKKGGPGFIKVAPMTVYMYCDVPRLITIDRYNNKQPKSGGGAIGGEDEKNRTGGGENEDKKHISNEIKYNVNGNGSAGGGGYQRGKNGHSCKFDFNSRYDTRRGSSYWRSIDELPQNVTTCNYHDQDLDRSWWPCKTQEKDAKNELNYINAIRKLKAREVRRKSKLQREEKIQNLPPVTFDLVDNNDVKQDQKEFIPRPPTIPTTNTFTNANNNNNTMLNADILIQEANQMFDNEILSTSSSSSPSKPTKEHIKLSREQQEQNERERFDLDQQEKDEKEEEEIDSKDRTDYQEIIYRYNQWLNENRSHPSGYSVPGKREHEDVNKHEWNHIHYNYGKVGARFFRVEQRRLMDLFASTKAYDILRRQRFTPEDMYWFGVIMGRMISGKDKKEVAPYLRGLGATGKSTLLKIILGMLDPADVTLIQDDGRTNFSDMHIIGKRIVAALDIGSKPNFSKTRLNSYISKEPLLSDILYGESQMQYDIFCNWMLAGNGEPPWSDKSGCIARRLLIFLFSEQVKKVDTGLFEKCLTEISKLLVLFQWMYLDMMNFLGSRGLWDKDEFGQPFLPEMIHRTKSSFLVSCSSLSSFLQDPDWLLTTTNDDKKETTSEHEISLKALNSAYTRFQKANGQRIDGKGFDPIEDKPILNSLGMNITEKRKGFFVVSGARLTAASGLATSSSSTSSGPSSKKQKTNSNSSSSSTNTSATSTNTSTNTSNTTTQTETSTTKNITHSAQPEAIVVS